MFLKSSKEENSQAMQNRNRMPKPRAASGAPSIIGSDVKIVGNVTTPGELQLDGIVEGDINCGALTMGEHGQITGTIKSDNVVIRGKVEGTIISRTVRLEKTCKVIGDVKHETVSVEAGAFVQGKFIHADASARSSSTKTESKGEIKGGGNLRLESESEPEASSSDGSSGGNGKSSPKRAASLITG